jgi:hypothetical protein
MKRLITAVLAVILATVFSGCSTARRPAQQPNYNQVRENHKDASQDMQREEDKKKKTEEEESE